MPVKLNEDLKLSLTQELSPELTNQMEARRHEIQSLRDLTEQKGTDIPSLFASFYKFVSNPSSVSIETYKRMVDTDDTIGSGCDFLVLCLAARMGRYQHKSKEITKWVNQRMDELKGGRVAAYKQMLSATWAGFSTSEKVWANTSNGFVVDKIVTLPPSTILFECERTGEITPTGILQYQRGYNPWFSGQGMGFFGGTMQGSGFSGQSGYRPDMFAKLGDLPFPLRTSAASQWLAARIPAMKCIHYAFDAQGKFGNPYGRSLLRRAFKYWVLKDSFLKMLSVALDRKGTPLTVVFADPNTTVVDRTKLAEGTSARGQNVGQTADKAAIKAFSDVHNDSVIVLPGKKGAIYDIESIMQGAATGDFETALARCDKGMLRALLIPALIFSSGDGAGSFALGEAHFKTFDKILDGNLEGFKQVLIEQYVSEMIRYNFPRSAWERDGFGDFSKRELSQDEKDKESEMIDRGINQGAIDMGDLNDMNKVRDLYGFEERQTPIAVEESLPGDAEGAAEDDLVYD